MLRAYSKNSWRAGKYKQVIKDSVLVHKWVDNKHYFHKHGTQDEQTDGK